MDKFDFVQFRWQQVRSFESVQAVTLENVGLRKQIVELQSLCRNNSGSHKQALYTFAKFLMGWLGSERQQLQSLRILLKRENEKNAELANTVSGTLKAFSDRIHSSTQECAKLKRENSELKIELEKFRKDSSTAVSMKAQELDRVKALVAKLQEELGAADSIKSSFKDTIDRLRLELEQSQADKILASNKYEVRTKCSFCLLSPHQFNILIQKTGK